MVTREEISGLIEQHEGRIRRRIDEVLKEEAEELKQQIYSKSERLQRSADDYRNIREKQLHIDGLFRALRRDLFIFLCGWRKARENPIIKFGKK